MEIEKLKVTELRDALKGRGLNSSGTKPILVQRLKEAISRESTMFQQPLPTLQQQLPTQPTPIFQAAGGSGGQEAFEVLPVESEAVATAADDDDDIMEVVPIAATENATNILPDPVIEVSQPEPIVEAPVSIPEVSVAEPEQEEPTTEEAKQEPTAKTVTPSTSQNNNQQRRGQKRKLKEDEPFVVHENEPDIDESVMCLDWFNSDLSMRIDKNTMMIGEPFHKDGWGYVWSGAKATHGFVNGAVWYEVKVLDELETKVEPAVHELRLGWSTDSTDMQLGENPCSFAYSGIGKSGRDCKFEDYGESFKKDDVIGAFLDMTETELVMTFTKNGVSQGVAYQVPKEELEGKALFPHVSSRNYKFEVNFGKAAICEKDEAERPHYTIKEGEDIREPWFAPIEGYTFAALMDHNVGNVARISKREDCEMIMLIGLPGCGKTTWVNKFVAEHPEKRYNVIGTAALVDKMKVNGESLKKHHDGKWDQLIQKCTRCLQEWLRMASQRRRNVVVDQTNVYPNAQKRKVRPFEGMIRKAIVIVPSDEDYKARIEAQEKEETKDVPDNAVMEMKANFTLPAEGEDCSFKEITFVELQRDEATKLVEKYNKDAKEKGFGKKNENKQNKKMRGGKLGGPMHRGMMRLRGMRGMPGMRGGRPNMRGMLMRPRGGPFMRGGPPGPMRGMMRGMPPMRGGPMMMRGGPGGPPMQARAGPMGPRGPRDGGRMMNKGSMNNGGMKSNQRQGNMGNIRQGNAGNNRQGTMGNNRQGNMSNQRQGNMGNQNRMGGGAVGRGPPAGNQQRNSRGPMNAGGSGGQMNPMARFSGNKFGGNQMRGGNQGGPSPWQQGSGPQQHQQQQQPFQPQPQQQRQYQQPQMMQPQQRQPQQPGNWGGNPAWGNQGGQGQMMGGAGGGGGYGNMGGNGGMNQGMGGMNQGGGMNQPWSGQMGNQQGHPMRQQPQQAWGGGGQNRQGGQGYPGSQQWGGFNR